MDYSKPVIPVEHQEAFALFLALLAMGFPVARARAIAQAYRASLRPVYVIITQRDGIASGLLASLNSSPSSHHASN